jgi:two-component sensor histidine kinase
MSQMMASRRIPMGHFADVLPHTALSRLKLAFALIAVWTVIGVFLALPGYLNSPQLPVAFAKIVEAWSWALLMRRAGIFFLLSIPFCIAEIFVTAVLQYPIEKIWFDPFRTPEFWIYYFVNGWLTYCAIVGALMALAYYHRFVAGQMELAHVEKRLLESKLNTLRMQLEPHFLFNALNTISSEVVSNPELVRDMIEDLGALLRLSLDYKDNQEIPLSQEIDLLDHYLTIQRVRFGDRIRAEIRVQPDVAKVLVPCMLLQPIVENAIRHGLSKRVLGGCVAISATDEEGTLEIHVEDDGVGLPRDWDIENVKGLGVRVTRERLTGLYPEIANPFEIRNRATGGVVVIMRVPLRIAGADVHGTGTV